MDFKLKTPKLDMGGAAAALQNIPKLLEALGTIGKELGEILGALGGIGTAIGSGGDFSGAKPHLEELNSSKATVEQNIHTIEDILAELRKAVGEDEANKPPEKKGKIQRVMDATLGLINSLTKMLDKVESIANNVDRLTNDVSGEEAIEICKEIKDDIQEMVEIANEAKGQVQEIISIAKGGDSKAKPVGEKSDKSGGDKKAEKSKGQGKDKDDDEEQGCWAKIKSCCCCCC